MHDAELAPEVKRPAFRIGSPGPLVALVGFLVALFALWIVGGAIGLSFPRIMGAVLAYFLVTVAAAWLAARIWFAFGASQRRCNLLFSAIAAVLLAFLAATAGIAVPRRAIERVQRDAVLAEVKAKGAELDRAILEQTEDQPSGAYADNAARMDALRRARLVAKGQEKLIFDCFLIAMEAQQGPAKAFDEAIDRYTASGALDPTNVSDIETLNRRLIAAEELLVACEQFLLECKNFIPRIRKYLAEQQAPADVERAILTQQRMHDRVQGGITTRELDIVLVTSR